MNTSKSVGEILTALRREKGFRQAEVADYLRAGGFDASQRSVSNWETGRTQPNADVFVRLCELYDVRDVQEVFCGRPGPLSRLNGRGRQRVEEYIRLLEGSEEFSAEPVKKESRVRWLPLYDLPVSAGTGQFLDSSDYELIEADETVPKSATFAVRIAGDSMVPRFVDRQTVYVRQQQTLEAGEIGIFLLNGSAYCKQLSLNGGTSLVSINSKYAPIAVSEYDELRVIGKVVG